jgi:hypothetical protein
MLICYGNFQNKIFRTKSNLKKIFLVQILLFFGVKLVSVLGTLFPATFALIFKNLFKRSYWSRPNQ